MRTLMTFIVQKEIEHEFNNDEQDLLVRYAADLLRNQGWDIQLQDIADDGRPWRPDGDTIMGNPIFQEREMGPAVYADGSSVMHGPKPPCTFCRQKQSPEGHDPCIRNLPGVSFACCGHGIEEGYIKFSDGVTVRGYFTEVTRPGEKTVYFPAGIWGWLDEARADKEQSEEG